MYNFWNIIISIQNFEGFKVNKKCPYGYSALWWTREFLHVLCIQCKLCLNNNCLVLNVVTIKTVYKTNSGVLKFCWNFFVVKFRYWSRGTTFTPKNNTALCEKISTISSADSDHEYIVKLIKEKSLSSISKFYMKSLYSYYRWSVILRKSILRKNIKIIHS